jgi:hypothetical protein
MEVVKEEAIKDLKAAGVELPETDITQAVKVSHHAGCRWVQRTKGMSESQAVDYKRLNVQEVEKEVREGFESAEHIWTAEDGIEYWFDPNNMIYVYAPREHNIITVYESDFSFAKHINRQIVLEQVQVIKKAWQEYKDAMDCHAEAVEQLDVAIGSVNDQIKVLESELELLKAKRDTLMAEKYESAKLISKASAAYEAECNKLFKYNKIIK